MIPSASDLLTVLRGGCGGEAFWSSPVAKPAFFLWAALQLWASISQKCPEVAAVLWINFPDVANRPQKARGAGLAVDTAALRPASYAWQAALARDQVTQNKSAQAALRLRLKEVLYAQLYC